MTDNQTPTDLEKVLDAIDLMSTFQLATVGDESSITKLKEVEELPEPMKTWLEKLEEPEGDADADSDSDADVNKSDDDKPDADADGDADADVDKTDDPPAPSFGVPKPKADDFEDEIEYAKALIRWDGATKAAASHTYSLKKPEKNDFYTDEDFETADKAYKDFVKALKEDLSPVLGEAIKKSLVPDAPAPPEEIDFDKIYEAADGAQTWDQFASEVGIEE